MMDAPEQVMERTVQGKVGMWKEFDGMTVV